MNALNANAMAAKVLGLKADISRLSAEVAGLRGQVKACHELLDKKDITIRNMETDKRVAQERTSAIYVETVRRLEGERDGLRKYVEFMAAKSCSGWLTCETHGFQVEACCNSCRARRALSTPTGTARGEACRAFQPYPNPHPCYVRGGVRVLHCWADRGECDPTWDKWSEESGYTCMLPAHGPETPHEWMSDDNIGVSFTPKTPGGTDPKP